MKITIAQRYKPFSHQPGAKFLLPFSKLGFQIYPAFIRVLDAETADEVVLEEFALNIQGPVPDFTIQQNLEKGCLSIWGHTQNGYMHYRILSNRQDARKFSIVIDKRPNDAFQLPYSNLDANSSNSSIVSTRLALGSSKSQDVDMIRRRLSMDEIFPLWHRLAQHISAVPVIGTTGPLSSLQDCLSAIASEQKNDIIPAFNKFFLAGFEAGLWPRLEDREFQGFCGNLSEEDRIANPLALLTTGAQLIEGLFIKTQQRTVQLLPLLPTELHCGRMSDVCSGTLGKMDFEWSKKQIRRAIFTSDTQQSIAFQFPKEITRFRLRANNECDKGQWIKSNTCDVEAEPGQLFLFDRFE